MLGLLRPGLILAQTFLLASGKCWPA